MVAARTPPVLKPRRPTASAKTVRVQHCPIPAPRFTLTGMFRHRSSEVTTDPYDALFHLANGEMTLFPREDTDETAWTKLSPSVEKTLDRK